MTERGTMDKCCNEECAWYNEHCCAFWNGEQCTFDWVKVKLMWPVWEEKP